MFSVEDPCLSSSLLELGISISILPTVFWKVVSQSGTVLLLLLLLLLLSLSEAFFKYSPHSPACRILLPGFQD